MIEPDVGRRRVTRALKAVLYAAVAGHRGRGVPVLMYHSVDASGSPLSVTPAALRRQLSALGRGGWRGLSAREYLDRLDGQRASAKEILITFDDGFENFYTEAAPILADCGFPATVFLVTDYAGERPRWFARDAARIERLLGSAGFPRGARQALESAMGLYADMSLLSWAQVRELARHGVDFASHGATHRFMSGLPADECDAEVTRSRRAVADETGIVPDLFCYPYGDCTPHVTAAVQAAGFRAAFLADDMVPAADRFHLPRIGMTGSMSAFDLRFAMSSARSRYVALRTGGARMVDRARQRLRVAGRVSGHVTG